MQANGDDKSSTRGDGSASSDKPAASASASPYSIWRIPPPVQRLFSRFPLRSYPPYELPLSAPRHRDRNVLYIFTTGPDADIAAPSFNPGCLKWQTLLNFAHIPFHTVPSSNHASPSGALPFLLPGTTAPTPSNAAVPVSPPPIPTSKLESWIRDNAKESAYLTSPPRQEAYAALLSHSIRLAYLYALYLHPSTFRSIAAPLYLEPSSRNALVRLSLEGPLRAAALSELMTLSSGPVPTIDVERLVADADEAFSALSTLLRGARWFSAATRDTESDRSRKATSVSSRAERQHERDGRGNDDDDPGDRQRSSEVGLFDDEADDSNGSARSSPASPGMLDASVFAYTHVIFSLFQDQVAESPARRLYDAVAKRQNLVEHRSNILQSYYPAYVERQRTSKG